VVGTGDTNNEAVAVVRWQNDNGAMALWENPTFTADPGGHTGTFTFTFNTVAALPTVGASWHVKGMADLSGDGRADVVFQNDNGLGAISAIGGGSGTTMTCTKLLALHPDSALSRVCRI